MIKNNSKMKVTINNQQQELEAMTVAEFAAKQQLPDKGVALAINNEMVPREQWAKRHICEGDDIVILKAFCGG